MIFHYYEPPFTEPLHESFYTKPKPYTMKSFQIVFVDPLTNYPIYAMIESPYYPDIETILVRLNETVQSPCEWKLHRTFVDGKEVEK